MTAVQPGQRRSVLVIVQLVQRSFSVVSTSVRALKLLSNALVCSRSCLSPMAGSKSASTMLKLTAVRSADGILTIEPGGVLCTVSVRFRSWCTWSCLPTFWSSGSTPMTVADMAGRSQIGRPDFLAPG